MITFTNDPFCKLSFFSGFWFFGLHHKHYNRQNLYFKVFQSQIYSFPSMGKIWIVMTDLFALIWPKSTFLLEQYKFFLLLLSGLLPQHEKNDWEKNVFIKMIFINLIWLMVISFNYNIIWFHSFYEFRHLCAVFFLLKTFSKSAFMHLLYKKFTECWLHCIAFAKSL